MYQHFCKLLSQDVAWNPWAPATPEPKIHSSRVIAQKYGIPVWQVREIEDEGLAKDWDLE
jgi:hypothetical protein